MVFVINMVKGPSGVNEIIRVIYRIGRHEVLLPINHNRKKKPLGQTSPVETVSKVNNPLS